MIQRMLSFFADPWASVEAFRKRRALLTGRSKPTYDAYPGEHAEPPIKLYVEARDAKGRLLREYVNLEGYGIRQLNWKKGAMRGDVEVRDWFVARILVCVARLAERLAEVEAEKKRSKEVRHSWMNE